MKWLGGRDSNPDNLLQRQMSYRWTTSQCRTRAMAARTSDYSQSKTGPASAVPGTGRREEMIGALMLGVPESDDPAAPLRYVGRVGTGFTMAELDRLFAALAPHRTSLSPFVNDPAERGAVFVTSRLRCRVEYREWTPQGILRHPSYKGLVTRPQDTRPPDKPALARPDSAHPDSEDPDSQGSH